MLFDKIKLKKKISSDMYMVEYRTIPQMYFVSNFADEGVYNDFKLAIEFLFARIGVDGFALSETNKYFKIVCPDPEKHSFQGTPLAYVIYLGLKEKKCIIREYDVDNPTELFWAEWTDHSRISYFPINESIDNYTDDEIAENILDGKTDLIMPVYERFF